MVRLIREVCAEIIYFIGFIQNNRNIPIHVWRNLLLTFHFILYKRAILWYRYNFVSQCIIQATTTTTKNRNYDFDARKHIERLLLVLGSQVLLYVMQNNHTTTAMK